VKRRDAGYTLFELMATLLILGSVFMLLIGGISMTRRVWERADDSSNRIDGVVTAENLLRRRLEHAFPQTKFDAVKPYADFKGTVDGIDFLSSPGDDEALPGLHRYQLIVSPQGDLVLMSASDLANPNVLKRQQVLLHKVESASMEYYGPSDSGGEAGWQDHWSARDSLPQLIRIRVQFQPGDPRIWPELIVHPATTQDTLCVLDPNSGRCRGRV
jgi:general secretion pathway protein J